MKKKKTALKKATTKKPAAKSAASKKPAATKTAARPAAEKKTAPVVVVDAPRRATYTPQPVQGIGWAPFRYPPQ